MDKHIDGAKRNGPYVQYADEILDIENAFAEQSISKLSQEEVLKLNEFMKMTFEWIDSTNPKIVVIRKKKKKLQKKEKFENKRIKHNRQLMTFIFGFKLFI